MPRSFIQKEPEIINFIASARREKTKVLQIATTNENKLREFRRLMPGYEIEPISLNVDEIQSLNHQEVAKKKAEEAWRKNGFNPILVEDTSLEIAGLNGRPGTLTDSFTKDHGMRKEISEHWLRGKDRRALARVTLAIYDGKEHHLFEGGTAGKIAETPRGSLEFSWDDIFIPDGQPKKGQKTFAEMAPQEKDRYSMRRRAVESFIRTKLVLNANVLELPEPFHSEIKRVDVKKLTASGVGLKFAYDLEGVEGNKPNRQLTAETYKAIGEEKNPYFLRYSFNKDSASVGMILTDMDREDTKRYHNGDPILWQVGPEKRTLAIAQRVEYFEKNTDKAIIDIIKNLEKNLDIISHRSNKESRAVEALLHGTVASTDPIYARAIKELGYKKLTSNKKVSRANISETGLFNKVGKYPRIVIGLGSMPAITGWRDVVTAGVLGHMPVFITRNGIFAGYPERQIKLAQQVKEQLKSYGLRNHTLELFTRNIGVAIGTNDPKAELEKAKKMYKEAGIKLFRIYTINGDPRCIEIARLLRKEFGSEVEIFAGQVTDKKQAVAYLEEARVDALVFGHGGGRQCTSAANGMAISTVEEIYSIVRDSRFNDVSLVAEGGVGTNIGPLLILGIDAVLYNQQLVRGTIETGGLFVQNKYGDFVQPYHGSASAPTMIIEAANPKLHEIRINASGRTKVPEGKPGYMKYTAKANSMAFWVDEFKYHAARTLADLGVENIAEMRKFLLNTNMDLLRIVSPEAAKTASPYGNGG